MMKKEALLWTIILLAGSTCLVSYAVSNYLRIIASTGTVKAVNVGVYWNQNCTETVTTIDWGMLEPGESRNVTIYLKNEGNTPINLSLNTSNWNPAEAENYISLTWTISGENLQPDQALPTTLIITVEQNVTDITTFNFDIIIMGEG
jgi:hypothetical protein